MSNTIWNVFCWAIVIIHIPELMWYYVATACIEMKNWWICRNGDM